MHGFAIAMPAKVMSQNIQQMSVNPNIVVMITECIGGATSNITILNSGITELDVSGNVSLTGRIFENGNVLASDWAVTDESSNSFIRNKPDVGNLVDVAVTVALSGIAFDGNALYATAPAVTLGSAANAWDAVYATNGTIQRVGRPSAAPGP